MSVTLPTRLIVFSRAFRASSARFMSSGASPNDPLEQSKKAAKEARDNSNNPHDSASPQPKEKSSKDASGNKEGIGMVDQVGSQSSTANWKQSKPSSK